MFGHSLQITTFILALGLLGCSSTKWTHTTLGESDLYKDRALCERHAEILNPNRTQPNNPYLDQNQQANQSASNTGDKFGRALEIQTAFNSCMSAKAKRSANLFQTFDGITTKFKNFLKIF